MSPIPDIEAGFEEAASILKHFHYRCLHDLHHHWAVWLAEAGGSAFIVEFKAYREWAPPTGTNSGTPWHIPMANPTLGPWVVQALFFDPDIITMTDWEIYTIPHIRLPKVGAKPSSYSAVTGHSHFKRGNLAMCAWAKDYISGDDFDTFDLIKLASSWLTPYVNWKAGLGFTGGGQPHQRNEASEHILRKAQRRHHLASSAPAALAR